MKSENKCIKTKSIFMYLRKFYVLAFMILSCTVIWGCRNSSNLNSNSDFDFGQDVSFLEQYTDSFVLSQGDNMIVVTPAYQGRVMTSTSGGLQGKSHGWVNYDLIKQGVLTEEQAKGRLENHIYVFGGEDRLWIGPEGGQYSIFFTPGSDFEFENWHTPRPIDTEPFRLVNKTQTSAEFQQEFNLINHSGTKFNVGINRKVRLLEHENALNSLGITMPETVRMVAYESENEIKNVGSQPWEKETGLLSIWILGMYKPSPATIMVIPVVENGNDGLEEIVNDEYFGRISKDRLIVKDGFVFFKGDGESRGKLGIRPQHSKGIAGSYDSENKVLTIVTYNQPHDYVGYVNSLWRLQEAPYDGDVIMLYNDGPVEPAKAPLGPFYEIETSSPAAQLNPSETITHIHKTIHFEGTEDELDNISVEVLGISLSDIVAAFE